MIPGAGLLQRQPLPVLLAAAADRHIGLKLPATQKVMMKMWYIPKIALPHCRGLVTERANDLASCLGIMISEHAEVNILNASESSTARPSCRRALSLTSADSAPLETCAKPQA